MKIRIKLFATLRQNREKDSVLEFAEDSTVDHVLKELKISKQEATIRMLNGRNVTSAQVLRDGDTLSLFPPVGGG